MKKLRLIALLIVTMMLIPYTTVFANNRIEITNPEGIEAYFGSVGALASLVVLLTGYINKITKLEGFYIQLLSWGISIGLCFAGNILNLGIFAGMETLTIVIVGIATGFVSNGIFDIKIVKEILKVLKIKAGK